MHSFSIDSLTGDTAAYSYQPDAATQYHDYPDFPLYPAGNQEYYDVTDTRTPSPPDTLIHSPPDSGIDSSLSPSFSDVSTGDVDKELAKLSKTSETLVTKPEPTSHEKPPHSFVALISMALQSSPEGKLLLGDIYKYVMDNFPYYNNQQRAWKNSIRYNLTINACFIKDGRSDCGKSNYWRVHSAVVDDFAQGDYRRRQAKRKSRRKVKSISGDVNLSTQNSSGYVTMSSTPIGYHPYSTVTYPPRTNHSPPVYGLSTSGGQLTSCSPETRDSLCYTPNGGYSAYYQFDYPQYASQYTSSLGYFSQPSPPNYGTATPYSGNYGYAGTSGLLQPVSSIHSTINGGPPHAPW